MKRLLIVIPLVLVCWLTAGCQQSEEVAAVDVEADIQAIKDIIAEWEVAANASNIDGSTSHIADDAVLIPPSEPVINGKEKLLSDLEKMYDQFTFQDVYEVKNVDLSGNLAVAHVTYSTVATPKVGGETKKGNGNWIMVFEKRSDSGWNCIYSIWSDENLAYPDQAE